MGPPNDAARDTEVTPRDTPGNGGLAAVPASLMDLLGLPFTTLPLATETRTEATAAFYVDKATKLTLRWETEVMVPLARSRAPEAVHQDPTTGQRVISHPDALMPPAERLGLFMSWLIDDVRPTLSRSSWRLYRSAVSAVLEATGQMAALDAISLLHEAPNPTGAQAGQRGGNAKIKGLPDNDLQALCDWILKRSAPIAPAAALWMTANRCVGLRPIEWFSACLIEGTWPDGTPVEDGPILMVENAKATNGRACGSHRTLSLAGFRKEELDIIREFLRISETWRADRETWMRHYHLARSIIYRANRAIWPRRKTHYTLYSGRHATSTRAKRLFDKSGVAALLGHASEDTAGHHYGRATSSLGGGDDSTPLAVPRAADDNIARVRPGRNGQRAIEAARARTLAHQEIPE